MKHDFHQTISLFACFLLISTVRGLTVATSQVSSSSQQPASLLAAAGSSASPEGSADAWLALLSEGGGKAAQAYRGDARFGAVGLWTVVSAAVLFSLLACCGVLVWLREFGHAQGSQARPNEAKKSRPASYLCQPTPRSAAGSVNGSCSYLASSSRLSVSVLGAPSPRVPSQAGTPRLVPLCPQLVVPDSSKLQCMLPDSVCHQRQNLTARICSSAARGGVPLFQARVADSDGDSSSGGSGIHLETLRGEERMASVTTQMVWSCPRGREPEMEITTGSGAKYATMTKNDSGGYTIDSGAGTLAVFAGQFATHDAQVVDAHGRTIAEVSPGGSQGSYEVVVFPKMDAGLIILGLLAIDKMESKPPSAR